MPDYTIKVIPRDRPITDHPFTGTKAEARGRAREIARELYPDASMRWSMDATVVFRDGAYVASVAVEQGEKEGILVFDADSRSEMVDDDGQATVSEQLHYAESIFTTSDEEGKFIEEIEQLAKFLDRNRQGA